MYFRHASCTGQTKHVKYKLDKLTYGEKANILLFHGN